MKYVVHLSLAATQVMWFINQGNVFEDLDVHTDQQRAKPPADREWRNSALNFHADQLKIDFDLDYPTFVYFYFCIFLFSVSCLVCMCFSVGLTCG